MALSFADLKKNKDTEFEKTKKELDKLTQKYQDTDDRFWYPDVDKSGNGYAVIRFLPAPKNEDVPFVRVFHHSFKGPTGSWYIENSLSTIGLPDPVGALNMELWNSGSEENKNVARNQKRKVSYISNILVIKDPANPENEGKVFLFRYGKKLWDKLNDKMNPKFQGETAVNPFDLWNGADLKLKIRTIDKYRNYDMSEFDAPAPVSKKDERLEEIWNSQHSLQEFIAADKFKDFDELKSKLDRVLGLSKKTDRADRTSKTVKAVEPETEDNVSEDEAEDSDLEYFKNLANK